MIGDLDPIAVYDVRDRWWMKEPGDHDRLLAWVRSYGVDPTYSRRFEIYLIDCPVLRVYDLAQDANGKLYRDGPGMAMREPYDVPLADLPPGIENGSAESHGESRTRSAPSRDTQPAPRDAPRPAQPRARSS